ncbi:MAG: enoyl-CoA hydratase, partial [Burkholderiales bacterium PBB5]
MSSTASSAVLIERLPDHVALVTINRPEARNAVNGDVARGLQAAIDETEADDQVWAVILTGAGSDAFSAGADLKAVSSGQGAQLATERGGFAGFVHAPRSKPWIAAVNGPALAGGCELVLACDLVVAVTGARFGLPEVKRGLVASAGGLYRLPRVLPTPVALEMILTGEPINAERALQFGMVNQLVAADQLLTAARALAGR